MKTVAFFNAAGGVGTTTLVYHLAWMLTNMRRKVLAVDLDPQSHLTSMFLDDNQLEGLWRDRPGMIADVMEVLADDLDTTGHPLLIPGDLALAGYEDNLSDAWRRCRDGNESAFRTITTFYRSIRRVAETKEVDLTLIDTGPNLGAIIRAGLVASEYVVIPLAPDVFSVRGLQLLGPQLKRYRENWGKLRAKSPDPHLAVPSGEMTPAGYVVTPSVYRSDRPQKAYLRWMDRIPMEYRQSVTDEPIQSGIRVDNDPYCMAALKNYRSLMPLAVQARKPMFQLKPADGAIGAHVQAVHDCRREFQELATRLLASVGLPPADGAV
jgi:cellulose biosynthesis protein BcsQ